MPPDNRTRTAVTRLIAALGLTSKDTIAWAWGPYDSSRRWVRWREQTGTPTDLFADLPRLRLLNRLKKCSVFLRGPQHVIYIDDLTATGVANLRDLDIQPRAIVETSKGSYQAWLSVSPELDRHALYLGIERQIGCDPGARPSNNGMQRLGRLPGFLNTKPERGDWALLRSATTRQDTPESQQALKDLAANPQEIHCEHTPVGGRPAGARRRSTPAAGGRDNSESGRDWAAACKAAARTGATYEDVCDAVKVRRPTIWQEKRHPERYIDRTVSRAIDHVTGQRHNR